MLYDILTFWIVVMALLLLWGVAVVIIARIKEPGLFANDLDLEKNNRARWRDRYTERRGVMKGKISEIICWICYKLKISIKHIIEPQTKTTKVMYCSFYGGTMIKKRREEENNINRAPGGTE